MSSVPFYRGRNALKNATTKIEIALLTKSLRLTPSFGVSSQTCKQLPLSPFPRDCRAGRGGVGWRTQETNSASFPFTFPYLDLFPNPNPTHVCPFTISSQNAVFYGNIEVIHCKLLEE